MLVKSIARKKLGGEGEIPRRADDFLRRKGSDYNNGLLVPLWRIQNGC
jgi:hypothetical protein